MAETQAQHSARLANDEMFHDLMQFAKEKIGQAMYDSLMRFKWAKYNYDEGVAALSFVLCGLLAVINAKVDIDPDAMATMLKQRTR
jgi:hypothetical protein